MTRILYVKANVYFTQFNHCHLLHYCREMWKYLSHLANNLLPSVSLALGKMESENDCDLVRQALTGIQYHSSACINPQQLRARSCFHNVPSVTDKTGALLPGLQNKFGVVLVHFLRYFIVC